MPTKSLASIRRSNQRRRQARSNSRQQSNKRSGSKRGLRVLSSDDVEACFDMCRDLGYHRDPDVEIGRKARGKGSFASHIQEWLEEAGIMLTAAADIETNQYSILDQDFVFGRVPGAFDEVEFTFDVKKPRSAPVEEASVEHWDQLEPTIKPDSVEEPHTPIQAGSTDNLLQPSILDLPLSKPHVSLPRSTTERRWSIPSPLLYHRRSESNLPNHVKDFSLQHGQEPPVPDLKSYKANQQKQKGSQISSVGHTDAFSQTSISHSPTPPAASSGYRPETHGTLVKRTPQASIRSFFPNIPSTPKKLSLELDRLTTLDTSPTSPWPLINLSACTSPQCIALVPMESYAYSQTILDWLRDARSDCGAEHIANAIEWVVKDLGMDADHSQGCDRGDTTQEDDLEMCFLSSDDGEEDEEEEKEKDKGEDQDWEWISPEEG